MYVQYAERAFFFSLSGYYMFNMRQNDSLMQVRFQTPERIFVIILVLVFVCVCLKSSNRRHQRIHNFV